jgi:hypothetical protein
MMVELPTTLVKKEGPFVFVDKLPFVFQSETRTRWFSVTTIPPSHSGNDLEGASRPVDGFVN